MLIVPVMLASLVGCEKAAPPAPPAPVVDVLEIQPKNIDWSVEFIGNVDSPQNVEVRARVEAIVEQVLFTDGAQIKKGDPLFSLDKKPLQERLSVAKSQLLDMQAQYNKADRDVKRYTPLAAKQVIAQKQLDDAISAVDVARANVASAKSRVESAQIDLGYTDIFAPVDGLIGARQVSVGELVGKGEPTLLATVSTLDPMWFYTNISETQYLRSQTELAKRGKKIDELPVTLILTDGAVHPAQGKIVFLDRAVDAATGTLRMRVEFPNPDHLLRPGLFGRIKIDLGERNNMIAIPERALVELQGKNFVWVVDAENKVKQYPVTVGDAANGERVILDGLKAGQRIVVEGLQKVRADMPVQPKAIDAAPAAAAPAPATSTP